MERDLPGTGGVFTTKPNARKNNTQPGGSRRLSGKSLGNPVSKENNAASDTDGGSRAVSRLSHSSIPRHRHSESRIEHRFATPNPTPSPSIRVDRSTAISSIPRNSHNTRIPRPAATSPIGNSRHRAISKNQDQPPRDQSPNQSLDPASPMRQPMDLRAAFKRAQEQTASEGSTDSDNTLDLQQAFHMANAEFNAIRGIDGSPSPAPRPFRRESKTAMLLKDGMGVKKNDLSTHLERFDRNHHLTSRDGPPTGLFTKHNVVPAAPETGRILDRKPSDSSPKDHPEINRLGVWPRSLRSESKTEKNRALARILPTSDSVSGSIGADIPVPSIEDGHGSDEELSLNFQPPDPSPEKSINWHLDADFTAGDLQFSESPRITIRKPSSDMNLPTGTPVSRRNNGMLDRIHQREVEAARMTFPEDTPAVKQMNHRLDEIRVREMEALSRRAVASSRLDEIRMRNSESRSKSPEIHRDPHQKPLEEGSTHLHVGGQNVPLPSLDLESRGESVRGTPVVVYKNSSDGVVGAGDRDQPHRSDDKRGALSRSDSHDLLRRLAQATSSSPREDGKETDHGGKNHIFNDTDTKRLSETRSLDQSPLPQEDGRRRNPEPKSSKERLTVGFADLMRIPSSESIEEKRTSMPASDVDPTDRITAELNLFAPLDNYSEKGSIRAPSPILSEPVDEETPRPPKIDPVSMPTPRVIGAYVDTPATVRIKGEGNPTVAPELTAATQKESSGLSPAKPVMDPSVTGRVRSLKRSGLRSSSVPTTSRRPRSSSRRRRPPINTARPPTVKEDIISILRANNIDDSTLENLDSILTGQDVDDQELRQMVNDTVLKVEEDLDVKFSEMSDRERELEAYDRMSKSLQTGLLGIRSAKKGIERLEDKVTHTGNRDGQGHPSMASVVKPLARASVLYGNAAPMVIALPRLYHKSPRFKFTTLGIVTICAVIWYMLECTFCYLYASPEYVCTPTIPCDWSPHEPYFPYTMPFMLDEWATGGKGRALALKAGEELGDMLAEISDWATDTDFTQFDERYMDVWQRKRHRRRLRKHALIPKWKAPQGYQARFLEWQAEKAARELGQEFGLDDETMSADEIVP